MPWCCHLHCTPALLVGGSHWGRGCDEALGVPLPTQGCKAWECTDVQNKVTFGHRAHDVWLSVLCRTTEQGCHVQSSVLFPRLPPGKVCSCSLGAPLSSCSAAKAPLLMPAQVSPCSGWLTPNETLRNLTSEVSLTGAAGRSPQCSDTLPCAWGEKPSCLKGSMSAQFLFLPKVRRSCGNIHTYSFKCLSGSGRQHAQVKGFVKVLLLQPLRYPNLCSRDVISLRQNCLGSCSSRRKCAW